MTAACSGDQLVDRQVAGLRLADEEGPGHVASVAGDLRPEVEQEHRAIEDRPIAGGSMRQRRLRSGETGDIEGEGFCPARPHQPLELQGERRLGHTRMDLGQQRRKRPVRDGTRRLDPLELGGLLHGTVRGDPAVDRHECHVRRGRLESPPQGVRDERRIDAHPPGPDRPDEVRPAIRQVVVRLDEAGIGCLIGDLDHVPGIRKDDDLVARDEEPARVAGHLLLAFAEREAGQVTHVFRADVEVGIHVVRREPGSQPAEPIGTGCAVGLQPGLALGQ